MANGLRERLAKVPEIERALTRLAMDRGGPRDLGAIRAGLAQAGKIAELLDGDLPDALADVSVLAYPNIFDETSCIAVMEAMAAGCRVVTTRRGALPETTAGFARLVEPDKDPRALSARFATAIADELAERTDDPDSYAARVDDQVRHVNQTMTWAGRVADWEQWLTTH